MGGGRRRGWESVSYIHPRAGIKYEPNMGSGGGRGEEYGENYETRGRRERGRWGREAWNPMKEGEAFSCPCFCFW